MVGHDSRGIRGWYDLCWLGEWFPVGQELMTKDELIHEAADIADGKTDKIGTTEHVEALVGLLRQIQYQPRHKLSDLEHNSFAQGEQKSRNETSELVRAALEGR